MNIFVAKLNFDTSEDALRSAFEEFGTVDSVKIIMDKFSGRSKGYGFVEMANDDEGRDAIEATNGTEFMGRNLNVNEARPRGGGGGGGGRPRGGGGGGGDRW